MTSDRSRTGRPRGRICSFLKSRERPEADARGPGSNSSIPSATNHLVTATYRVSFNVRESDRFVVLGPSGCGKSTLLKAVGGYIRPVEGDISLDGAPVKAPAPDRVFVFQEFDQLLPWKTVKENIVFALTASGKLPAPRKPRSAPCTISQK